MTPRCEVCRGSRQIRLPLYKPVAVRFAEFQPTASIDDSGKTYSCPECGDVVPQARLYIAQEFSTLDSRIDDAGYARAAQKQAAHAMIAHLIDNGYIAFEWERADERMFTRRCKATLGVVSTNVVAHLEERMSERQEEVAQDLATEAMRQIRVWGSHYSGDEGNISKAQAVASVRSALDAIIRKRREQEEDAKDSHSQLRGGSQSVS